MPQMLDLLPRIRERISYDPDTGVFTRLVACAGNPAGSLAGGQNTQGYIQLTLFRHFFYGHRLAWLMHYEEWPERHIDHANGVTSDNRIANLRLATPSQNQANSRMQVRNSAGFKGVYAYGRHGKYAARLAGRYLGSFLTPEEAHEGYITAARLEYGDFARAA